MTFDNSNRKHLREAEKAFRLAEENRIAYTRTIMSTVFGRAWMHDLLLRCNIFHTPWIKDSPDSTAFNCGGQNIGLRIFGDVAAHCPHEYTLMMTEASIKDAVHDRRNDESSDHTGTGTEPRTGWHPPEPGYDIDATGFVINTGTEARAEDREPAEA